MNFYAISALINLFSSLILGSFVYFKNKKVLVNITFTLFTLSVAFWSFGYYFWQISTNSELALFWSRVLMAGAIFIPATYFHFTLALVELIDRRKKFLIFTYFLFSVFFILNFTSLFVNRVEPLYSFKFWPLPGPVFHFFLVIWLSYVIYSTYLLFRKYKLSEDIKRAQLRYVFLGMTIGFLAGSTNYFLWYKIPIPPFANILVSVYVGSIAYAILKYRFMDIRFAIGRIFVYIFSFATVIALSFLIVFLNNSSVNPFPFYLVGPMIALFTALIFRFIFRFYEKIASRYFYYTFYSSQTVLNDLGRRLTRFLNLDQLTNLITNTLMNTMKLERTVILLRDPETGQYKIQKNIGFKEENGISLVKDNFLTQYLEKTQRPLVYEELNLIIRDTQDKEEKQRLENLRGNMKRIEAVVCLPLIIEKRIIGLVVLGNKISKEPYSVQDLELLTAFANQSSTALSNARLYDQIQDLSQNLQQKVDEQTKEIREAYQKIEKAYEIEKEAHQLEKQARKGLQRLEEAKNQFMMATQHHLRTPLTSMRGYLDLILGGSYGKVSKKLKEVLKRFEISTKNEVKIVNEFLDISQFQLGKEVVFLQPDIDIEPILEGIVEELEFESDSKEIYLKLEKPREKLPKIKADPEKLKVALFNIVDNAVKYTNKGGVIVEIKITNSKLQIIIKDTGIGMSREDISTLFTKLFERGETAKKIFATGRGIGLFIASQIIKSHQGEIRAESEGRNKGSTFYVELPTE